MRVHIAGFLSLLFFAQCAFWAPPAETAAINFGGGGSGLSGEVPCNKVGALLLADATVLLNGTEIKVHGKVKGKSQPSSDLLTGILVKTQVPSGKSGIVNAYAYFSGGPSLGSLPVSCCDEHCDLGDGSTVQGPISDITESTLNCGGHTIPLNSITAIHSPRVFRLALKVANGEAASCGLTATCTPGTPATKIKAKTSSTGPGIIAVAAIVTVLGAAIAIPIAVPIACSHHHHNNDNSQQELANYWLTRTNQQKPPPKEPFPQFFRFRSL